MYTHGYNSGNEKSLEQLENERLDMEFENGMWDHSYEEERRDAAINDAINKGCSLSRDILYGLLLRGANDNSYDMNDARHKFIVNVFRPKADPWNYNVYEVKRKDFVMTEQIYYYEREEKVRKKQEEEEIKCIEEMNDYTKKMEEIDDDIYHDATMFFHGMDGYTCPFTGRYEDFLPSPDKLFELMDPQCDNQGTLRVTEWIGELPIPVHMLPTVYYYDPMNPEHCRANRWCAWTYAQTRVVKFPSGNYYEVGVMYRTEDIKHPPIGDWYMYMDESQYAPKGYRWLHVPGPTREQDGQILERI